MLHWILNKAVEIFCTKSKRFKLDTGTSDSNGDGVQYLEVGKDSLCKQPTIEDYDYKSNLNNTITMKAAKS